MIEANYTSIKPTTLSPKFKISILLITLSIAAAFIFYLRIVFQISLDRQPVANYFLFQMLPIALAHIAIILGLNIYKPKVRWTFLFWILSVVILLIFGGILRSFVLIGFVLYVFILLEIGAGVTRSIFTEKFQGFGFSIGLGIVISSVLGAYLAAFHLFKWWIFLSAMLGLLLLFIRQGFYIRVSLPTLLKNIFSNWNLSTALALEGLFLIGVYVYVDSSAPEVLSDSMRLYWPYIKLLKHYSGFFDNPFQWSYVIPQAGLTYAGGIFLLLGSIAVRWSIPLVLSSLIAVTVRGNDFQNFGSKSCVAILIASSPMVLQLSASLMQDCYVSLVIVLIALICLEAENVSSSKFWFAIGFMVSVAWTSKFSSPFYIVPLLFCALYRYWKDTAAASKLRLCLTLLVGLFVGAAPWLWNTYLQSGNPFFPLFLKVFPAPLWPDGVDPSHVDIFKFPSGVQSFFLWPFYLTYNTDQYGQEHAGALGLILLVALVFIYPALRYGNFTTRSFLISGVIGTGVLWLGTLITRYWLPGLWLVTIGIVPGAIWFARAPKLKVAFSIATILIFPAHVMIEMFSSFSDPKGWPWAFYTGRVNEVAYINHSYYGFEKLRYLTSLNEGFPRIWFTIYEATGHLDVEPMEANIWEMWRHGLKNPRSWVKFLGLPGSKFWILDEESEDAIWLRSVGITQFYLEDRNLILKEGPIALYRIKSGTEALDAFDRRAKSGTDLLMNGGFEIDDQSDLKFWSAVEKAHPINSPELSFQGSGCFEIPSESCINQTVALPPQLKKADLLLWVRSVTQNEVPFYFRVQWIDEWQNLVYEKITEGGALKEWKQYQMTYKVPEKAVWVTIYLCGVGSNETFYVDEMRLYSR